MYPLSSVLAGPVVRRVEPGYACVWLALPQASTLELKLFKGSDVVGTGVATTAAIGRGLHIALITAECDEPMEWGECYEYEVYIGDESLDTRELLYPEGLKRLSFVLMGKTLEETCLVHGSCRHPTKPGLDALSILDDLVENSFTKQQLRPQTFVCSGDIIYADSPSESLLALVGRIGDSLLGYCEPLPGLKCSASEISLQDRKDIAGNNAKIYDPPARQLFGFGEYLAMHLLVLSPSLWPEKIPKDLQPFYASLYKVRRALAHTSCYAIFDDHEVTDDWNLTRAWTERVLAAPLGRRMVCNGLAAFALVHTWGNVPSEFEKDGPGDRLLAMVLGERADDQQLSKVLGIPEEVGTTLTPPQGGMQWHFRLCTPAIDLRGLDTRTMRSFPSSDLHGIPDHLSEAAMQNQLSDSQGMLILVAPAPMAPPPFSGMSRWLRRIGDRWNSSEDELVDVYFPDRGDEWVPRSSFFQNVLNQLPASWICLGGDTHIGYAASLKQESGMSAIFVSSGMKRQSRVRNWRQHLGYKYPWPRFFSSPSIQTSEFVLRYLRSEKTESGKRYEYFAQNNIGVLTFSQGERLQAKHSLWWRDTEGQIAAVLYEADLSTEIQ